MTKHKEKDFQLTGTSDHHLERLGRPRARGQRRAELRRLDERSRVVDVRARVVASDDLLWRCGGVSVSRKGGDEGA